MASGTAGTNAREYPQQMIHYLRKSITHLDNGRTVDVGRLPAGAVMVKPISGVQVNVAFNGDTTNTLDIGPSTDAGTNLWMTIGSLASIAFVPLDEAVSMIVAIDTLVQAKVVCSASASAGQGEIIIAYVPDNDQ